MDDSERAPGERLRIARERVDVSRRRLAEKMGVAQSTIRAHENGQNGISPELAKKYAAELAVSPSWILYGVEEPHPEPQGIDTLVPVVGQIGEHVIGRLYDEVSQWVPFPSVSSLSGHLSAYVDVGGNLQDDYTRYVIIDEDIYEDLLLSDEVLLQETALTMKGLSIWRVGAEDGWAVFYRGQSQAKAHAVIKIADMHRADLMARVLGVVVGRIEVRHRPRTVTMRVK